MDVCIFNWELASKFLPLAAPLVALYIFAQWKTQKGKEVLANEAKLLTYDLLAIKKIIIKIENKDVKDINQLYNEYKSLSTQIEDKINFLDNYLITNTNENKVNNYKKQNFILLDNIRKFLDENNLIGFLIYINLLNHENEELNKLKNSIDEIISISKRLSLYN